MGQKSAKTTTDNWAITFIAMTMMLDGISSGISMPVFPLLLVELTGVSVSRAAIYGGWLAALFSFVQFFAAPVLGSLSDRYGRRPILLGSLVAAAIDYLILGFARSVGWLFFGTVLVGVSAATVSAASAYVADVTDPEDRAGKLGVVIAAFAIGVMLGPMLAGLLGAYGTRVPFFVAAGLAFLNVLYGFLVLPESLDPQNRRPFFLAQTNPLSTYLRMRSRPTVRPLLGALLLQQIAAWTVPAIWSYIVILKFGWSQREIGMSLSFQAAAFMIIQGALLSPLNEKLGTLRTALLGSSCLTIGLIGFAFSSQSWAMLAFIIPSAFGSLARTAIVSYLSYQVSVNSQGELQGAIASVGSITTAVTPLLMTQLFSQFSSKDAGIYFPGTPFLVAAAFAISALLVVVHVLRQDAPLRSRFDARR